MKRSILPGFIKRKSISSLKEESTSDLFKETDKSCQLSVEEIQALRESYGLGIYFDRRISHPTNDLTHVTNKQEHLRIRADEEYQRRLSDHRSSIFEGIFRSNSDVNFTLPFFCGTNSTHEYSDVPMVDQEDIIALTRHVRSFSDALNNLRNTFKESCQDGTYSDSDCQSSAHDRLGEVLTILKGVLAKYPPLHSPDILSAAANIITKIKTYDYSEGEEGPIDFYAAIDQLALSFSGSVSDFLMGDKEMTLPNATNTVLDQFDDGDMDGEEDFDGKFSSHEDDDESEKFNESEDSLDRLQGPYDLQKAMGDQALPESDENSSPPPVKSKLENAIQRTDELDKTLLSIEGSVDIALQRTKVWAKYAKDILNYIERRSHLELEFSRSTAKLATQTRSCIVEESYLPFQSIYVTVMDNDIQFANNYHKSSSTQLLQIVEKLTQRQKDHDSKRSKIKNKWKSECKRLNESRENLRAAKKMYLQKQKDLEKFNKQQSEGKDEKGFSLGKKKGQDDFKKSAEDSEENYKHCVKDANTRQYEIERTKEEVLVELRQLVYQCDLTMKSVTIAYFQMMDVLLSPLPIQYRTLVEASNSYEEGQQFADFVRLQQSTSNQAMRPKYNFEQYKGDGIDRFNAIATEPSDRPPSPGRKVRQAWGTGPRTKGSATDDTDSLSSHSLERTPHSSPSSPRKGVKLSNISPEIGSDEDHTDLKDSMIKNSTRQQHGHFKNQKLSAAAKMHKFRKLRSPSKCKECDSYVYFNGAECERCSIICHKKCLETLAIKCGNKRLPRKMTTFGVDFQQHLAATKRKDIPYIIEKCIDAIDEGGLSVKGIYRVSGVKSKVEKLCQQFETGGDLVELSTVNPHLVTSVLKLYLRQLPEPLLTFKEYDNYIKVAKDSMNLKITAAELEIMNDQDSSQYEEIILELHNIIKTLPASNFYTAAKLIRHLKRVAENADENQMNCGNLAIVFGPTLLRPEGNPNSLAAVMDMSLQTRAVELLVLNSHIFSCNADGEVDIETMTGEKYRPSSHRRKGTKTKKKIVTKVPDSIPEHKREDSVSAEFSQELLDMMESSQRRIDEDRTQKPKITKTETVPIQPPGQLPGQAITFDYDGLQRESDILSDLPEEGVKQPLSTALNDGAFSDSTADDESCSNRLDSIESLLSGDLDFNASSPPPLPDTSHDDIEDDDLWMNRFGGQSTKASARATEETKEKQPLTKSRSASTIEVKSDFTDSFTYPSRKKKNASFSSRLETTTYSFSLGNTSKEEIEQTKEEEETISEEKLVSPVSPGSDDSSIDLEPSVWVKRDSKERVPVVRKHLKTISIKTTTNIAPAQATPVPTPAQATPAPTTVQATPVTTTVQPNPISVPVQPTSVKGTTVPSTDSSVSSAEPVSPTITVAPSNIGELQVKENENSHKPPGVSPKPVRSGSKATIEIPNGPSKQVEPKQSSEAQQLSPGLKTTPFTLNTRERLPSTVSTDSEIDALQLLSQGGEASKQLGNVPEAINRPCSPEKIPPAVLPKPKKPLDKKSWTADLIKSKSQSLPEQPQPGSLNDKILNRRNEEKVDDVKTKSSSLNNKSVKEILTKFQTTPSLSTDSNDSSNKSSEMSEPLNKEEKYV